MLADAKIKNGYLITPKPRHQITVVCVDHVFDLRAFLSTRSDTYMTVRFTVICTSRRPNGILGPSPGFCASSAVVMSYPNSTI